ncbi:MAG: LPS assembly lipoprotein LptE [Pseudomonadota bacterium]
MSLSDRRHVLSSLGAGLLLSGCFRPMLAEDGQASALRGQIVLPDIEGRLGYYLYQSLEDRLGRPEGDRYRLDVAISTEDRGLAISQDNDVTRISVTATVAWALYLRDGTEPVLRDREVSQSGYNATGSLFATRQTRLDIERRLARDLGERISRAILARSRQIARAS